MRYLLKVIRNLFYVGHLFLLVYREVVGSHLEL